MPKVLLEPSTFFIVTHDVLLYEQPPSELQLFVNTYECIRQTDEDQPDYIVEVY